MRSGFIAIYSGLFLLAAVFSIILLTPVLTDLSSHKSALQQALKQLTGRHVTLEGDISLQLFPYPAIHLAQINVDNISSAQSPVFLSVERVDALLDPLSLLRGNVVVTGLTLHFPELALERTDSYDVSWWLSPTYVAQPRSSSGSVRLGAAAALANLPFQLALESVTVQAGTLHIHDAVSGWHETINAVEGGAQITPDRNEVRADLTGQLRHTNLRTDQANIHWTGLFEAGMGHELNMQQTLAIPGHDLQFSIAGQSLWRYGIPVVFTGQASAAVGLGALEANIKADGALISVTDGRWRLHDTRGLFTGRWELPATDAISPRTLNWGHVDLDVQTSVLNLAAVQDMPWPDLHQTLARQPLNAFEEIRGWLYPYWQGLTRHVTADVVVAADGVLLPNAVWRSVKGRAKLTDKGAQIYDVTISLPDASALRLSADIALPTGQPMRMMGRLELDSVVTRLWEAGQTWGPLAPYLWPERVMTGALVFKADADHVQVSSTDLQADGQPAALTAHWAETQAGWTLRANLPKARAQENTLAQTTVWAQSPIALMNQWSEAINQAEIVLAEVRGPHGTVRPALEAFFTSSPDEVQYAAHGVWPDERRFSSTGTLFRTGETGTPSVAAEVILSGPWVLQTRLPPAQADMTVSVTGVEGLYTFDGKGTMWGGNTVFYGQWDYPEWNNRWLGRVSGQATHVTSNVRPMAGQLSLLAQGEATFTATLAGGLAKMDVSLSGQTPSGDVTATGTFTGTDLTGQGIWSREAKSASPDAVISSSQAAWAFTPDDGFSYGID